MKIIYKDNDILLCIKPAGVLSTDEDGGVPDLVRLELGDPNADIRTVHRLDRAVSGLMLLARNAQSASILSRQIREGGFSKHYLAVVHGTTPPHARLTDLMYRDKARKMSFVTDTPAKGVQEAILDFERLGTAGDMSLVRIGLITGRTHQIRVQFSSRGHALLGERKYSTLEDDCPLALFSHSLEFVHPKSGEKMAFTAYPENIFPWCCFQLDCQKQDYCADDL